jgi:hypothetical protein
MESGASWDTSSAGSVRPFARSRNHRWVGKAHRAFELVLEEFHDQLFEPPGDYEVLTVVFSEAQGEDFCLNEDALEEQLQHAVDEGVVHLAMLARDVREDFGLGDFGPGTVWVVMMWGWWSYQGGPMAFAPFYWSLKHAVVVSGVLNSVNSVCMRVRESNSHLAVSNVRQHFKTICRSVSIYDRWDVPMVGTMHR